MTFTDRREIGRLSLSGSIRTRIRLVGWAFAMMGLAMVQVVLASLILTALGLATLWIGMPLFGSGVMLLRRLADLHRRWADRVMGVSVARAYRPAPTGGQFTRFLAVAGDEGTWRDMLWAGVDSVAGVTLCAIPAAMFLAGIGGLVLPVIYSLLPAGTQIDRLIGVFTVDDMASAAYYGMPLGLAFLALWWWAGAWLMKTYARLVRGMLDPGERARLSMRVEELSTTRRETIDSQAAELRRIERDLHDGAQARLVSLGMSLGMAQDLLARDPGAAAKLLADARESTGEALTELRDLVRGIHPPVLADRGLDGALRALALACPLRVDVDIELPGRPLAPVESAAYFATAEALTNVAKHSGASRAWLRVRYADGALLLEIGDDGKGGAAVEPGGGLHGVERRLAAFDGTLALTSPPGGPTVCSMRVPCEVMPSAVV